MIIFDLVCEHEHAFEGWFHSAQEFSEQQKDGMVQCPQCASPVVRKVPSAVAFSRQRGDSAPESATPESAACVRPAASVSASSAMALYRQLARAMVAISEDVGSSFAEEARRMHYQEIAERPIRGQTTDEEYEALQDEGITVIRLPVIKEEDLN
ncbi:MAG: DUF1178 family protein [Betaproteobacteria bacterium]